jgi:ubiquinone/menaquinone biosynthesis C-methylase UbiE
MNNDTQNVELEFTQKYDDAHAINYFIKHNDGFWQGLSNRRDHQVAQKALRIAGKTESVLDMPCGTGRFWGLLAEDAERSIHGVDFSQDMIDIGMKCRDSKIVDRIHAFQGSVFLPVEAGFVDTVFCIRLIHHIGSSADRIKLLKELARISNSTVIISLWVDGNFKAWKRKKLEAKRAQRDYQNRFVIPASVFEEEAEQAGFDIKTHIGFLPLFSMWRTYVLEKKKHC